MENSGNALYNCDLNLILTRSADCVIVSNDAANQAATFSITETKLYFSVVTLSTQYNPKLLQQIKSGLKITINWNKYTSKPDLLRQNGSLNHLVEPSFRRINILFILSFKNDGQRTSSKRYYLPNIGIH